jgi:L-amino acid N-acyltransferase YncA
MTPAYETCIRACTDSDIPAIQSILEYYVQNTVITLAVVAPTLNQGRQGWQESVSNGLPYLVASDQNNVVLAYCYATPFRGGGGRGGYRRTVELSLFCHPDHIKKRLGSQMLHKLVQVLKTPTDFPEYVTAPREPHDQVRALLACMSVDESAWKDGLGLRDFYVKHGFEEVGHMKKVGYKFDRWYVTFDVNCSPSYADKMSRIDTRYLQLLLW